MFLHEIAPPCDIITEESKFGYSEHIKLAKKIIGFGSIQSQIYVKNNVNKNKTALPTIAEKEGYTFLYWIEQGTGKKYNAGDMITVEENSGLRAFTAAYELNSSSGTYSYDIELIKGKTEELGTLIGDKVDFESCNTTSSSIVATNYNSGECIVTAVDKGTAVIKAEYKGDTYIIGVKVYSSQEEYQLLFYLYLCNSINTEWDLYRYSKNFLSLRSLHKSQRMPLPLHRLSTFQQ